MMYDENGNLLWSNKDFAEAIIELPNFKLNSVDCSTNDEFIDWVVDELSQHDAKSLYDNYNDALLEEYEHPNY